MVLWIALPREICGGHAPFCRPPRNAPCQSSMLVPHARARDDPMLRITKQLAGTFLRKFSLFHFLLRKFSLIFGRRARCSCTHPALLSHAISRLTNQHTVAFHHTTPRTAPRRPTSPHVVPAAELEVKFCPRVIASEGRCSCAVLGFRHSTHSHGRGGS